MPLKIYRPVKLRETETVRMSPEMGAEGPDATGTPAALSNISLVDGGNYFNAGAFRRALELQDGSLDLLRQLNQRLACFHR